MDRRMRPRTRMGVRRRLCASHSSWTCTFWTTGCGSPASPRAAWCTSHTLLLSYCSCGTGHGRDPLHPVWGLIVCVFCPCTPALGIFKSLVAKVSSSSSNDAVSPPTTEENKPLSSLLVLFSRVFHSHYCVWIQ